MARDLCTKSAWDHVRSLDQALRSSLVRFDMALQPTDLILELSARPLECIVESKMNVRMPLVQAWRAPDIDLLSVRERQADVDLVETAGAMVFARCLHHDPAGGYTPEATLEAGNVLGNNCAQGLARLHSLEVDLDGALHASVLQMSHFELFARGAELGESILQMIGQ